MTRFFPETRPSLSRRLSLIAQLAGDSLYDARRFWRQSFTEGAQNRENLRARIAIGLHFLEYGLSLDATEPGHGFERATQLAGDIDTCIDRFGPDPTTEIALSSLAAWCEANAASGLRLDAIREVLDRLSGMRSTGLRGGTEDVTAQEIRARGMMDFLGFAKARHSIRSYTPDPVPPEAIERAVRAAQQSPSSCNRQTCRARIWTEPEARRRILALQSGNRGFGDQLGGVAVITSDLAHWEHAHERYQGWVDGGMFAMSFAYGLHAEGLGAVMLNWSERRARDRKMRALTGLPDSELIITLVGFGCMSERLRVPVSQRRPLDQALVLNAPLPG
ncbi:MAG: nitroreductase family protein [Tropicimonas sp.]|uniref:nitroreductase family protein n=1 Tax=Tropicimonas sp. TaxID=2067044 RepID=UPI003A83BF52